MEVVSPRKPPIFFLDCDRRLVSPSASSDPAVAEGGGAGEGGEIKNNTSYFGEIRSWSAFLSWISVFLFFFWWGKRCSIGWSRFFELDSRVRWGVGAWIGDLSDVIGGWPRSIMCAGSAPGSSFFCSVLSWFCGFSLHRSLGFRSWWAGRGICSERVHRGRGTRRVESPAARMRTRLPTRNRLGLTVGSRWPDGSSRPPHQCSSCSPWDFSPYTSHCRRKSMACSGCLVPYRISVSLSKSILRFPFPLDFLLFWRMVLDEGGDWKTYDLANIFDHALIWNNLEYLWCCLYFSCGYDQVVIMSKIKC